MRIKKIGWIVLFLLLTISGRAQAFFDKLEAHKEITSATVTQKMFQMLAKIASEGGESKEYVAFVSKLKSMRVFTTENQQAGALLKSEALQYVKAASLSEVRMKTQTQNTKFYAKENGSDKISELLIFVDSNEHSKKTVLLSLIGNIELSQIGTLKKNMNLPNEVKDIK